MKQRTARLPPKAYSPGKSWDTAGGNRDSDVDVDITSLFSKEEVISTRLDPIFNLYNLSAISMVIMLMMQMRKNDFVLAALLIRPHKSLRSRENLIARPQEGSRTLDCQSWGTRSNEIRIHVSVLQVMSSISIQPVHRQTEIQARRLQQPHCPLYTGSQD